MQSLKNRVYLKKNRVSLHSLRFSSQTFLMSLQKFLVISQKYPYSNLFATIEMIKWFVVHFYVHVIAVDLRIIFLQLNKSTYTSSESDCIASLNCKEDDTHLQEVNSHKYMKHNSQTHQNVTKLYNLIKLVVRCWKKV